MVTVEYISTYRLLLEEADWLATLIQFYKSEIKILFFFFLFWELHVACRSIPASGTLSNLALRCTHDLFSIKYVHAACIWWDRDYMSSLWQISSRLHVFGRAEDRMIARLLCGVFFLTFLPLQTKLRPGSSQWKPYCSTCFSFLLWMPNSSL